MTLKDLKPGQKCKIKRFLDNNSSTHRIVEMGLTPGTTVEVEKTAPFGDPMEIKVRGYHLSLRKNEVNQIQVELA